MGTRKTWRCFFCDEVFRNPAHAREHFGATQMSDPACKIKGHENDLVAVIRAQEDALASYREEDSRLIRAWRGREVELAQEVRRSEEIGYERGIRDMQRLAAQQFGKEIAV